MNAGLIRLVALLVSIVLAGCVSPIHSKDPETRRRAVGKIDDEKELFLIAMNIGVSIGFKQGSYTPVALTKGDYMEDVRVMAVNRLTDTDDLLRCSAWKDNDLYEDKATEDGRFVYKGETYYLNGDYKASMIEKVSPGDAVRDAAKKRIKISAAGKSLAGDIRSNMLPSASRWMGSGYSNSGETTFVDYYGQIKKNNPYDQILSDLVDAENSTAEIVSFLMQASVGGPYLTPNAYDKALRKINGIDSTTAKKLFRKLFLGIEDSVPNSSSDDKRSAKRSTSNKNVKAIANPSQDWPWLVYQYIDNPEVDIVKVALDQSAETASEKILGRVKDPNVFVSIFGDATIVKSVPKDKTKTLSGAYGSETTDLLNDEAAKMLKRVNDQNALVALAHGAKLFSIRAAAIARVENENELAKIARGEIKDCPYDTSLAGHNLFGNGIEWISKTQDASKANLQRLAIARMNDAKCLRDVRKECKSEIIKKAVTARLSEIGQSDVAEICAYDKYDSDLFSMVAGLKDKSDIQKVSQSAKLKGIRILAGSKLDTNTFAALSKKEAEGTSGKPVEGKLVVAGYYLGMNIEDAFAKLAAEHPDVKPTIYLDGGVLCIAGSNGRDIAWANAKSLDVHWLTLPPSIVKQMAGFKTGSFEDLERAVEKKLGISFGYDVIRKGSVSQKIGNFENTEGETLRYFISEIGEGEDFGRSVRKAVNQHTIDTNPLNSGFGAALANAFEDAQQADENRANARRPMFQPQGSLQVLLTKNAAKGSLGSKGSIVKGASLGAAFQAASELGQKMDELKGAKKELGKVWSGMKSEVKKGMSEAMGDGIKDLKKSMDELDAAADALKNLGN